MKKSTKILLSSIAASILLIGCGGGGGSSSTSTSSTGTVSGTAVDGPIANAKVCLDLNFNKVCDSNEPVATTDGSGRFSVSYRVGEANASIAPVLILPTADSVDTYTGNKFTIQMYAPRAGHDTLVVSPITTVAAEAVYQKVENNETINPDVVEEVVNKVAEALDLNGTDITQVNPTEDPQLLVTAVTLANVIEDGGIDQIAVNIVENNETNITAALPDDYQTIYETILNTVDENTTLDTEKLQQLVESSIETNDTAILESVVSDNNISEVNISIALVEGQLNVIYKDLEESGLVGYVDGDINLSGIDEMNTSYVAQQLVTEYNITDGKTLLANESANLEVNLTENGQTYNISQMLKAYNLNQEVKVVLNTCNELNISVDFFADGMNEPVLYDLSTGNELEGDEPDYMMRNVFVYYNDKNYLVFQAVGDPSNTIVWNLYKFDKDMNFEKYTVIDINSTIENNISAIKAGIPNAVDLNYTDLVGNVYSIDGNVYSLEENASDWNVTNGILALYGDNTITYFIETNATTKDGIVIQYDSHNSIEFAKRATLKYSESVDLYNFKNYLENNVSSYEEISDDLIANKAFLKVDDENLPLYFNADHTFVDMYKDDETNETVIDTGIWSIENNILIIKNENNETEAYIAVTSIDSNGSIHLVGYATDDKDIFEDVFNPVEVTVDSNSTPQDIMKQIVLAAFVNSLSKEGITPVDINTTYLNNTTIITGAFTANQGRLQLDANGSFVDYEIDENRTQITEPGTWEVNSNVLVLNYENNDTVFVAVKNQQGSIIDVVGYDMEDNEVFTDTGVVLNSDTNISSLEDFNNMFKDGTPVVDINSSFYDDTNWTAVIVENITGEFYFDSNGSYLSIINADGNEFNITGTWEVNDTENVLIIEDDNNHSTLVKVVDYNGTAAKVISVDIDEDGNNLGIGTIIFNKQ